jgi:hypothetical protein
MPVIYSAADEIIVWLGSSASLRVLEVCLAWVDLDLPIKDEGIEEDESMQGLLYLVGVLKHGSTQMPSAETRFAHTFAKVVCEILTMPWFHRAWVLQEVALAKKVVVALDCCLVPWERYFAALETLIYLELEKAADWMMHAVAEARRSYLAALVLDIAISRVDWFESDPKKRLFFSRLALFFRGSEATDIRDKLFAVWNLSAQAISSQSHRCPYFPMTYTMPIEKI